MTEFDQDDAEPAAALTPEQAALDVAELRSSLADLAGLVSASMGLPDLLARVARFAARAIPGADGAGVTLLEVDRPGNRVEALAASDPFVAEIDEIQYVQLGEGPCITAALERRTVRSGSLGGEKQWPRFGPRARSAAPPRRCTSRRRPFPSSSRGSSARSGSGCSNGTGAASG